MRHPLCFTASLLSAVFMLGIALSAQGTGVKTGPITQTNAASGDEMFKSYCAVCHGVDAKGKGPAAGELKTAVPDLTTMTKRHEGKYPSDYVIQVLQNGPSTARQEASFGENMVGSHVARS